MSTESTTMTTKQQVAREILALLEKNERAWTKHAPSLKLVKIALSQPHNVDAQSNIDLSVHQWGVRRRMVIVPNNCKMAAALNKHLDLFDADEQKTIATFLMHVMTYEQFSKNEITYAGVWPFPEESEYLMRGLAKQY